MPTTSSRRIATTMASGLSEGIKLGIGTGIKAAAATADYARPPRSGVTVLIYHRVGRRARVEMDLDAHIFERQISELAEGGRVVDIDRGLAYLDGSLPQPSYNPVVITFDDGTSDFAEIALPILVKYGVPALLYVSTEFLDSGREFPYAGTPLSWDAARDTTTTGLITLGSHTHTHALLDRVDAATARDELDRSIERLSEETGLAPKHFAYPKALLGTPAAAELVRERFVSASISGTKRNVFLESDPYQLARSPIQARDGMRWFRRKVDGGLRLEDDLRGRINRLRYRGASE
ncbi:MAG: polysaccharide deacetylase family protein [Actinomycetes bacterium]